MNTSSRIFVAGHLGLVGSAIMTRLAADGFRRVLTARREELDLRNQASVDAWFDHHRPEYVFVAAGTVGGILANISRPAEFIYDNLMIHATTVHAAYRAGVRKLLYLGSACVYPRDVPQPMSETALLAAPLEPTNEPYAIAKIAGIRLCQSYRRQYGCDFISAMPTNLYGPHDNFDLASSHVLPALIRKFHDARTASHPVVSVWGSGTPRREFLHVEDLADACVFLMDRYSELEHINVGTGSDISIRHLAELVRDEVCAGAEIVFDPSKPDGVPRRVLDVSRIHALGWRHRIELREGVAATYRWFTGHVATALA